MGRWPASLIIVGIALADIAVALVGLDVGIWTADRDVEAVLFIAAVLFAFISVGGALYAYTSRWLGWPALLGLALALSVATFQRESPPHQPPPITIRVVSQGVPATPRVALPKRARDALKTYVARLTASGNPKKRKLGRRLRALLPKIIAGTAAVAALPALIDAFVLIGARKVAGGFLKRLLLKAITRGLKRRVTVRPTLTINYPLVSIGGLHIGFGSPSHGVPSVRLAGPLISFTAPRIYLRKIYDGRD
jgi:hypothetical protein